MERRSKVQVDMMVLGRLIRLFDEWRLAANRKGEVTLSLDLMAYDVCRVVDLDPQVFFLLAFEDGGERWERVRDLVAKGDELGGREVSHS